MRTTARTNTLLLGIVTTILVGWVLHVGAAILQPLVIALLLAVMLQPIVRGLARWHIPPAVTVILIVALLFLGLARVGVLLQANVVSFIGSAPAGSAEPLDPMSAEQSQLAAKFGWTELEHAVRLRIERSSMPGPLASYLRQSLDQFDPQAAVMPLLGGGFGFTKNLVLVVIYMLFIFAEQAVFRGKILSIAGDRREDAEQLLDTIGRGIQHYLGIKTLVSFVTGALCYSALVALEIPYALLFGFLTFLLNYIPTFGSIFAGTLPVVTALAVESSWNKAVAVVATYLVVNLVLGSFLEPKILGRELNLSPLVIIVSVVVWAGLWGVVGTFLAVPLTASLQIILASQDNTRPIALMLSSGPPRETRWRRGPP